MTEQRQLGPIEAAVADHLTELVLAQECPELSGAQLLRFWRLARILDEPESVASHGDVMAALLHLLHDLHRRSSGHLTVLPDDPA